MSPSSPPEGRLGRVVFFNRVYAPDDQATAMLLTDLCRRLAAIGRVSVAVVTDVPGPAEERGVRFSRPDLALQGRRRGGRLRSYLRYYFRSCLEALRLGPMDRAIIWTDPPMLDAILGLIFHWRRVPFYVTVQDLYPQIFSASRFFAPGPVLRLLQASQALAYRSAQRIVCISEDTRRVLADLGFAHTTVIENWDPLAAERAKVPAPANSRGPLRVLYSGNLGRACDVDAFAAALRQLPEPERFEFIFRGGGVQRSRLVELSRQWPQIRFVERLPLDQYKGAPDAADVHLILMPSAFFGMVYPSKLYAILAAGTPVCASVPRASAMYALISRSGAGRACAAEDPATLAKAFIELWQLKQENPAALAEMRTAARRCAEAWDGAAAAAKYRELLEGNAA